MKGQSQVRTVTRTGRALLCALAGLLLAAVAFAAPAAAGAALSGDQICDFSGTAKCLSSNNGPGGVITNWVRDDSSGNQRWHLFTVDPCGNGGTVSHTCPYPVGSGLNDQHFGDQLSDIVSATRTNRCAKGQDNGQITLGTCGDTGYVWDNAGLSFVNVHEAGRQGTDEDILGNPTNGGMVVLNPWQSGFSQWAQIVHGAIIRPGHKAAA